MNASEKAQEILKKFEEIITSGDYPGEAHACAMYHVKSIINILEANSEEYNFYIEVQKELNLL